MVGCRECGKKVQDKVMEKKERGEELTKREQKVLDADKPEDALPSIFGIPLHGLLIPGVPTCWLCTTAGVVGSTIVTALLFVLLREFSSLAEPQMLNLAYAVFGTQVALVALMGRYPYFGAKFGLSFESFLNRGGDQELQGSLLEPEPEIEFDIKTDPSADRDELPDDYFEAQEQRFREIVQKKDRKIESLQQSLSHERAERMEAQQEREQWEEDAKEFKQEKDEKEQQIEQELLPTIEDKEKQIRHLSDFGYDRGDDDRGLNRIPLWIPAPNGGGLIGPYWYVKTVEVHLERDDYYGTAEFAFVVNRQGAQLPNHIPDYIDWDQIPRWEDHLLPDPRTVKNPAEYEHMGKKGYPHIDLDERPFEEYPNVLFQENKARFRENRELVNKRFGELEIQHVSLTLAFTKKENDQGTEEWFYVPPAYDPRGFEQANEQRNLARKRYRQLRALQNQLEQKDEYVAELSHEIELLEEQLNIKDGFLKDKREETKKAIAAATKMENNGEEDRRAMRLLNEEVLSGRRQLEKALEGRRHSDERRVEEATDTNRILEENENMRERERKVDRAFQRIYGSGWESLEVEFDFEAIDNGGGEHTKEEVISQFRREVDRNDEQFGRLARTIDEDLIQDLYADGGEE